MRWTIPRVQSRAIPLVSTASLLFAASQAHAQQEAFPAPQPLTVKMADENGVDVLSGNVHFPIADAAIGDLAHVKTVPAYDSATQPQPGAGSPPERDNFIGGLVFFEGHCEQEGEICYAFTGTLKRVTARGPNGPSR